MDRGGEGCAKQRQRSLCRKEKTPCATILRACAFNERGTQLSGDSRVSSAQMTTKQGAFFVVIHC